MKILRKGDLVEFRPIVTGRVYHIRKTKKGRIAYIEFEGRRGYVAPPYKVTKL